MIQFHSACSECTNQEKEGIEFCVNCCNFECNWSLPNLNDATIKKNKDLDEWRKIAKRLAAGKK
jgi:hypothetical protein